MAQQFAGEQQTGTSDLTYNAVSVVYHSLHGAETYERYARDADEAGDQQLGDYFRSAQQQLVELAEEGKSLLVERLAPN